MSPYARDTPAWFGMADEGSRKRMRFCEHCGKEITYPVYKKHKEEFYDHRKKEWKVKYKSYPEEVDAEDDAVIRDSLAISTTGIESAVPYKLSFLS